MPCNTSMASAAAQEYSVCSSRIANAAAQEYSVCSSRMRGPKNGNNAFPTTQRLDPLGYWYATLGQQVDSSSQPKPNSLYKLGACPSAGRSTLSVASEAGTSMRDLDTSYTGRVSRVVGLLQDKSTTPIICAMREHPVRLDALKRAIPSPSEKRLTASLRSLEAAGAVRFTPRSSR